MKITFLTIHRIILKKIACLKVKHEKNLPNNVCFTNVIFEDVLVLPKFVVDLEVIIGKLKSVEGVDSFDVR